MPECFNSPYGTKYFPEYAEPIEGGPTCKALKEAAEKHKVKISLNICLFVSCRQIISDADFDCVSTLIIFIIRCT